MVLPANTGAVGHLELDSPAGLGVQNLVLVIILKRLNVFHYNHSNSFDITKVEQIIMTFEECETLRSQFIINRGFIKSKPRKMSFDLQPNE